MLKKPLILLVFIALTLTLNSCGVMFGGSKYNGTIIVKDNPNAEISVDGQKLGMGQTTNLFPRNRELVVEVKDDSCEKKTQTFNKSFRTGNFILSAFAWGILGIGIDLGTGASYKPDHRSNPAITKSSTKDFIFEIDYDCN